MYSTQPKSRSSKRRAILHSLLCLRRNRANVSKPEEEPHVRYIPTHAAKSFLQTTTPKSFLQSHETVGRLDLALVNSILRAREQAESFHIEHADDDALQHQVTLGNFDDVKHADDMIPSALPLAASARTRSQGPLPPKAAVQRPLTGWVPPTNWHTSLSMTSSHGPSELRVPQFNFDTPYPNVTGRCKKMRGREHGRSPLRDSFELRRPRDEQVGFGHAIAIWSEG